MRECNERLTVVIKKSDAEILRQMAKDGDRAISSVVRKAIEEYLSKKEMK